MWNLPISKWNTTSDGVFANQWTQSWLSVMIWSKNYITRPVCALFSSFLGQTKSFQYLATMCPVDTAQLLTITRSCYKSGLNDHLKKRKTMTHQTTVYLNSHSTVHSDRCALYLICLADIHCSPCVDDLSGGARRRFVSVGFGFARGSAPLLHPQRCVPSVLISFKRRI